ncbi:MAG: hypothetical protein GYB66_12480 [Chloroflexi bacterium]|nr:hypothetical protein [Chloroflexota bacterium]
MESHKPLDDEPFLDALEAPMRQAVQETLSDAMHRCIASAPERALSFKLALADYLEARHNNTADDRG